MLPPTPQSLIRRALAAQIVKACPPEVGDEIALTGSAARGAADEESDVELNFWAGVIPPESARLAALEAAGVVDLRPEPQPREDGSLWIGGVVGNIPFEAGWQTFADTERLIDDLLCGETTDRARLVYADILATAIPLRTGGRIAQWQARLAEYPPALRSALIGAAVSRWTPDRVRAARRLAAQGETLALAEHLLADMDALVRLLYALNERWEPSRKWRLTAAVDLPTAPQDWQERVKKVFAPSPDEAIFTAYRLVCDALALVPETFALSTIRTGIERALQER